jgi:hypothetical protein
VSQNPDNARIEKLRFERQALESELAYRREKLWKVFSWTSGLLVAITGGFIALRANVSNAFQPSRFQRGMLIFAVVVLTLYGISWITQNYYLEDDVEKDLEKCDRELGIEHRKSKRPKLFQLIFDRFGYRPTLTLLALAALISILFS